jgi:CubicO group peptidase (beta-lactamase class C family)
VKRTSTLVAQALALALALALTPAGFGQSAARGAVAKPRPAAAPANAANGLPRAQPEAVGMSSERLKRIRAAVEQSVAQGRIAGAVTLVMRRGKVAHLEAVGMSDREAQRPMREDAIFRIASMTKAVTSVAAMILVEDGKLLLNDPVSKFVPEFKGAQVAVPSEDKKSYTLVPARSEISIRHLLTHTSGITYRFSGTEPWARVYQDAGVVDGLIEAEGTMGDNVKKLAKLPLMHQPGEKYSYGLNTDVLGYVVEVVSGMSLDEFFRARIFAPLKMADTHFTLPAEKLPRLAEVYQQQADTSIKAMGASRVTTGYLHYSATYPLQRPRAFFSGGAGLVSTAGDYARFLQMLLGGGELDGARVLGRKTVELMTVNHVGDLFGAQGFGLGFSVVRDVGKGSEPSSVGTYGWGGFFYTNFIVDPKEQMIAIFMSQLYPANDVKLHERFRSLAYQAIVD